MLMKIAGVLCTLAIGALIGAFFFAPHILRGGLGFGSALFLLCPIAMVMMMWSMNKGEKPPVPPPGSTNDNADAP